MVGALVGLGAVGASLHVAGSVLIVYGQTLVKVAHCVAESGFASTWALPDKTQPLWRRPDGKWKPQRTGSKSYATAGWVMFGLGNAVRFVAMRFAAQTVLSGLGSLQFVFIPLASRTLLGIRALPATLVGVAVVLLGNVLIVAFGPAEVPFTLQQLRYQWTTRTMQAFCLVLGGLLCSLQMLWRRVTRISAATAAEAEQQRAAEQQRLAEQQRMEAGGDAWADEQQLLAPARGTGGLLREPDTLAVFGGAVLFSAVASFVGAWSVLFSKSLTYVVTALPASLGDWYSWVVLVAFLGTAAFWVRQSNRGLKLYPATLIMPLMQAFWMCMSVIEGGIYFDELVQLPSSHLTLLLLGLILALLGAVGMGIAGFAAEQPQRIFAYSAEAAAANAKAAAGGAARSPGTQMARMVPLVVEDAKPWRAAGEATVHRVHVFAAPAELEPLGSMHSASSAASPADLLSSGPTSPAAARLSALRSPGQQVLSREGSLLPPLQLSEDADHATPLLLLPEGHRAAGFQAPSANGVQLRKPLA